MSHKKKNPRNTSGMIFESIVCDVLRKCEMRFDGPKSKGIDFKLLDFGIGIDAKGQIGEGTDFEGWPLKVWKHSKEIKKVVIVNRLPYNYLKRRSYLDIKKMIHELGGEIVHIDDFKNWLLELKGREPEPFF